MAVTSPLSAVDVAVVVVVVRFNSCAKLCDDERDDERDACAGISISYLAHCGCACECAHILFSKRFKRKGCFVERRQNAAHKPFESALQIIQGISVLFLRSSLLLLMLAKRQKHRF